MTHGAAFLERLPVFTAFSELIADEHFLPVPSDWYVVITDIEGSTQAIAEGRYRDVNTLGAACIAAAQNALHKQEVLYVFGGDGATFVLAPEQLAPTTAALRGVADLANTRFGLSLRVGVVSLTELHAQGAILETARYRLVADKTLAMFRGGGLALADKLIKADPVRYAPQKGGQETDLSGLSCRWQPVPAQQGQVMSLIVVATATPTAPVYARVLRQLEEIFDHDLAAANPIRTENLRYKTTQSCLRDERRFVTSRLTAAWLARSLEIVAAVLTFRWGVPPLVFNPTRYAASMRSHSDYRKFDDGLKMVLDCTQAQIDAVRAYLERERDSGSLCYGMHLSPHALMTCLVDNLSDGGHIHFIDGGNGGYAMAAKELKAQLAQS